MNLALMLVTNLIAQCDPIDFNNDGLFPDTADVDAFRAALAGEPCPGCNDIDFNNDGLFPDTADLDAFLRVFSGGPCHESPNLAPPSWVTWAAQPGALVLYVSGAGSDSSGDGSLARPFRSPRRAFSFMRPGKPDAVLLRRGDTFEGGVGDGAGGWNRGGESPSAPMYLGAWGDGERPVLTGVSPPGTPSLIHFQSGGGVSNVMIDGIELRAPKSGPRTMGISSFVAGSHITIQDCKITGFTVNIALQGTLSDVKIIGCLVADAFSVGSHSQGLYLEGVNGAEITHTFFDHNGWNASVPGAKATVFNHNAYVHSSCTNVTFSRCISTRASATGLQLRAGHGVADRCLVIDCPLGITLGHDDIRPYWPGRGNTGNVTGCLIVGGGDIDILPRGMALGFAWSVSATMTANTVMQLRGGDPCCLWLNDPNTGGVVAGNTFVASVGKRIRDDRPVGDVQPALVNNREVTQLEYGTTFEQHLMSIDCTSIEDYIGKARAHWSRRDWDARYSAEHACAWPSKTSLNP